MTNESVHHNNLTEKWQPKCSYIEFGLYLEFTEVYQETKQSIKTPTVFMEGILLCAKNINSTEFN